MFKRAAALITIITALALVVFLASAYSSIGRFNPTAQLIQNNHSAKVGGPWSWDYDEECAVVRVQLVQNGVIARGDSSMITTRDQEWHATVTTAGTLHSGSANVRATADVENENGTSETYVWTQQITLR